MGSRREASTRRTEALFLREYLDYNMKLDRDGRPVDDPEARSLGMSLIGQRNNDLCRFRVIRLLDVLLRKFGRAMRVRVVNRDKSFACPAKVTKNPDQLRRVHFVLRRAGGKVFHRDESL